MAAKELLDVVERICWRCSAVAGYAHMLRRPFSGPTRAQHILNSRFGWQQLLLKVHAPIALLHLSMQKSFENSVYHSEEFSDCGLRGYETADIMGLNAQEKNAIKRELVDCLRAEKEVRKIIIFGSFLHSDDPHDLDVAVFQDTTEPYLPLAMKYRKKTRSIARRLSLDILPVKFWAHDDPFLAEIAKGEVVYER